MNSLLLRSTPFRVAVILGTAFLVASLVAALVAFELIARELNQRMDQSITDNFKVISEAYGDSDQVDLIDSVRSHARATVDNNQVFGLAKADGTVAAGNVGAVPLTTGWATVPARELGLDVADAAYRVFVGAIGSTRLLVGSSFTESREIAALTLTTLGWAGAAIFMIVVAIGSIMATRAQRRIDGIAQIMGRVGHGELAARISLGRRGDDIDQLAQQVNAALDRLGALVEGMRQVSFDIAHDLKTPLNRLAITIESATKLGASQEEVAGQLAQAEVEIRHINSTFDALMRIAQIEAGARRARFVPVQLKTVLNRIADAYGEVAEENQQTLAVRQDGPLPVIEGDSELLTQLCANLVENSIRHSGAGASIIVTAVRVGERINLTFADNGPGIPTTEHEKVFQRLYRLEKSRTTPGSGLGLSLVKAIAELHGAKLTIGSNQPGLWIALSFPIAARDGNVLTNP